MYDSRFAVGPRIGKIIEELKEICEREANTTNAIASKCTRMIIVG